MQNFVLKLSMKISSLKITAYTVLGLKRMVSGYPDANIYGYPADSDIIRLVLLALYFKFKLSLM